LLKRRDFAQCKECGRFIWTLTLVTNPAVKGNKLYTSYEFAGKNKVKTE